MSHGRTFYRCGCLQSQCRCFSRAGHTDRWLDYPCPKHADITIATGAGYVTIKTDGRVPPGKVWPEPMLNVVAQAMAQATAPSGVTREDVDAAIAKVDAAKNDTAFCTRCSNTGIDPYRQFSERMGFDPPCLACRFAAWRRCGCSRLVPPSRWVFPYDCCPDCADAIHDDWRATMREADRERLISEVVD